ncbi:STAS domain-containing protein [Kitasatospora sp. NPDC052896]|uniref:STAS domain-containing protein n=1 Tax=Kitasatospora sp. NPDC052896 TaxID=3364061 RepID=UPI0037C95AA2
MPSPRQRSDPARAAMRTPPSTGPHPPTPGTTHPLGLHATAVVPPLPTTTDGAGAVVVRGEIDQDCAGELRVILLRALHAHPGGLELDLTQVTFLDCAGLNTLLRVRHEAREVLGRPFTVRAASPQAERLLRLTETRALFLVPTPPNGRVPTRAPGLRRTG